MSDLDTLLETITDVDLRRIEEHGPAFVMVSGGKDSTAVALLLRERGVEFTPIHADTGWEHSLTERFVDELEEHIGPIERCGFPGGMREMVRRKRMFSPKAKGKFCTRLLKQIPLAQRMRELTSSDEALVVVGIRARESVARSRMMRWDGETLTLQKMVAGIQLVPQQEGAARSVQTIFRPILEWTVDDVIAIHRHLGVPMNPLYSMGAKRVGCWPCNQSGKMEMRFINAVDPGRIDELENFEAEVAEIRGPGGNGAHFFMPKLVVPDPWTVRRHLSWARTVRGGIQHALPFFEEEEAEGWSGGCGSMGYCEGVEV